MDALEAIHRMQAIRLRVLRYASVEQLCKLDRKLYDKAVADQEMFWIYFLDWYEFHGKPDNDRSLLEYADRACRSWLEVFDLAKIIYSKSRPDLGKYTFIGNDVAPVDGPL
jgi:hypothetical protein